jgi:hypothetical protein
MDNSGAPGEIHGPIQGFATTSLNLATGAKTDDDAHEIVINNAGFGETKVRDRIKKILEEI